METGSTTAPTGWQVRSRFLRTAAPTSSKASRRIRVRDVRGIGPVYAKKLVQAFGETVFDLIETAPDRLREVDGIGPVRASRIVVAWAEQKIVREIMVFLHAHGVGTSRAVRIYKTYGTDAVRSSRRTPTGWRATFAASAQAADAIAMRLGIEADAPARVRAGIAYALTEALHKGIAGCRSRNWFRSADKLLQVPAD